MVSIVGILSILLSAGTMTLIYAILYDTFDSALLFAGKFRDKKEVLSMTLIEFLLGTLISMKVHALWKQILGSINLIQPLGLILVLAMYATNEKVNNWSHTDQFSLSMYIAGALLLIGPTVMKYQPWI